jgi:hypothetical protein
MRFAAANSFKCIDTHFWPLNRGQKDRNGSKPVQKRLQCLIASLVRIYFKKGYLERLFRRQQEADSTKAGTKSGVLADTRFSRR